MAYSYASLLPGPDTYFFTVRLRDADSDLLTRHIELLRLSVGLCQFRYPFRIDDAVVLPDRIHALWTLPEGDRDYAARWHSIKTSFANHVPGRTSHGPQRSIWQRRFWEQPIVSTADLIESRFLIYQAPVRAGLVDDPADWPHSFAGRGVRDSRATRVRHLRVVGGTG